MAKDKGESSNPPAAGGLEPSSSTVGQAPTPADAKSASSTPGQEPGVTRQTKKMRKENRSLRERLRAAEKLAEDATKSQLSDAEKRDARLAELEAQAQTWKQREQELIVKNAVSKAALKRNIDPDLAEKLLNWSTLKIDEEGQPRGIGKALDGLLEQYPILKQNGQQPQAPTIGATNPQQQSSGNAGYKVDPMNPPKLGDHLQWGK